MKSYFACLLILISAIGLSNAQNTVFCFYSSWATYRPGIAKFDVEDIDVDRCTHVTYSFIGLREDGSVNILDNWADVELGGFRRTVDLKQRNPNIKTLVSMGGWIEGSGTYSRVINNPTLRANMVGNIKRFVSGWGFDGFNFDWQYPANRGGSFADAYTYIDFFRELRHLFGEKFILTATVRPSPDLIGTVYNVEAMNELLDFVNLMTYDFNGAWNGRTGQNSPLYPSSLDQSRDLNSDAAVRNWIRNGISPQKLLLGLSFYGQTFTLANPRNNGLHAATTGPGLPGDFSGEPGILMYSEICRLLNCNSWSIRFDWEQMCPYIFRDNQWIGYDNPDSIRIKTRYAVDNNLGGVMVWSIDHEDHKNTCGKGRFPLLKIIDNVFKNNDNSTTN